MCRLWNDFCCCCYFYCNSCCCCFSVSRRRWSQSIGDIWIYAFNCFVTACAWIKEHCIALHIFLFALNTFAFIGINSSRHRRWRNKCNSKPHIKAEKRVINFIAMSPKWNACFSTFFFLVCRGVRFIRMQYICIAQNESRFNQFKLPMIFFFCSLLTCHIFDGIVSMETHCINYFLQFYVEQRNR